MPTVIIRPATPDDAALLHELAVETFGLACPPGTTAEAIEDFVTTQLSAESFAGYLSDAARQLWLAEVDGAPAGYTMVIHGEPTDADVAASVTVRPTAELSKCYLVAGHHGAGVSQALVERSVAEAAALGAKSVWLGVNEENARANRFYEKSGFGVVGNKKFLLGGRWEDDFVRERPLGD